MLVVAQYLIAVSIHVLCLSPDVKKMRLIRTLTEADFSASVKVFNWF
jgi:hypothetical protein